MVSEVPVRLNLLQPKYRSIWHSLTWSSCLRSQSPSCEISIFILHKHHWKHSWREINIQCAFAIKSSRNSLVWLYCLQVAPREVIINKRAWGARLLRLQCLFTYSIQYIWKIGCSISCLTPVLLNHFLSCPPRKKKTSRAPHPPERLYIVSFVCKSIISASHGILINLEENKKRKMDQLTTNNSFINCNRKY